MNNTKKKTGIAVSKINKPPRRKIIIHDDDDVVTLDNNSTLINENDLNTEIQNKNTPAAAATTTAPPKTAKKIKKKIIIHDESDGESDVESDGDFVANEGTLHHNSKQTHKQIISNIDSQIKEAESKFNPNLTPLQREKQQNEILNKQPNTITTDKYETYPTLDDPNFAIKIAKRKEFFHTRYDGTIYGIKEQSNMLCNLTEFELMPNQLFVKNFMSLNTPYNSLLLYFGLGTGKTCAAIGVAEEMRSYMRQIGVKQKIMVIASPNVQDNFKIQLFDKRKLVRIGEPDGLWNIENCVGNSLLKEINPMNLKGLSREKVISQIESIINSTYLFLGYGQLLNYFYDNVFSASKTGKQMTEKEREYQEIKNIKEYFNNMTMIIDEVHNIHINEDNLQNKKVTYYLMKIAKHSDNLRLVLLSATPMYNSYKEIIWLTNLMNINDNRALINVTDVFDKNGNFVKAESGKEDGRKLLKRKLTGYISYVRGENPYLFPFRVYPDKFSKSNTFEYNKYPTLQMNKRKITTPLKYIKVYLNSIGKYQRDVYEYILFNLKRRLSENGDKDAFEKMTTFGYTILQLPLQALNIVFPNVALENAIEKNKNELELFKQKSTVVGDGDGDEDGDEDPSNEINVEFSAEEMNAFGKTGLKHIMNFDEIKTPQLKIHNFEYKRGVLDKNGRIFSEDNLPNYSSKISQICSCIKNSKGIVLVYSQYIYCGIVPVALALEEMGFSRYSSQKDFNNLMKTRELKDRIETVDALTMKKRSDAIGTDMAFYPAKYIIITGDKAFSPSNAEDIKYATDPENKDGSRVKVILISKAGSEGLDFKFIRQIHVLEPWYNMNRLEQIIGRGVRSGSHCALPFEERNVEIYLHATLIDRDHDGDDTKDIEESADLYVYRLAEQKALQIGRITRILKESSVDCILNIQQTNFSVLKLQENAANRNIKINVASGSTIDFGVGDQPMTEMCDYLETCEYTCNGNLKPTTKESETIKETYNLDYVKTNYQQIVDKIRRLFKDRVFYKRAVLINSINLIKKYPIEQIYYALTYLIENKHEYLVDSLGRIGNLINKGEYYLFQPSEITDTDASIYERTTPIEYQRTTVGLAVLNKIYDNQSALIKKIGTSPASAELKTQPFNSLNDSLHQNNSINGDTDEQESTESPESILSNIYNNFNTVFQKETVVIKSSDKNWYRHANNVREHFLDVLDIGITEELLQKYIVYHILDTTSFVNKVILLHYVTDKKVGDNFKIPRTSKNSTKEQLIVNSHIINYYKERLLYAVNDDTGENKTIGVYLNKNDKWIQLFILNKTDKNIYEWTELNPADIRLLENTLIKRLTVDPDKIAHLIGFINMFKEHGKDIVFRIKETISKRINKGFVCCNGSNKSSLIKNINMLLNKKVYSETNKIQLVGFCVLIEIIMRHYTETAVNDKIYFFDAEHTTHNNISVLRFEEI